MKRYEKKAQTTIENQKLDKGIIYCGFLASHFYKRCASFYVLSHRYTNLYTMTHA